ncbi:MAG: hypothetical protein OXB87_00795 [Hyphomicrobiales bacterium]|nr:hypothetical protein [Hyphomicrobiales bacterium]
MRRLLWIVGLAAPLCVWSGEARAQFGLWDPLAGDMYYALRTHAQFYTDVNRTGEVEGFEPADANLARLNSGFDVESEPGFGLSAALGLVLGLSSRGEFEGSWTRYRGTACGTGISNGAQDSRSLSAVSRRACQNFNRDMFGLMGNLYHDFDYVPFMPQGFAPFVGFGLGYNFAASGGLIGLARDEDEPNQPRGGDIRYEAAADANDEDAKLRAEINAEGLRWGIYAGATLRGVELSYRYFGGGANNQGHVLSLGYRF